MSVVYGKNEEQREAQDREVNIKRNKICARNENEKRKEKRRKH